MGDATARRTVCGLYSRKTTVALISVEHRTQRDTQETTSFRNADAQKSRSTPFSRTSQSEPGFARGALHRSGRSRQYPAIKRRQVSGRLPLDPIHLNSITFKSKRWGAPQSEA